MACALFTAVLVALGLRLRGDLGALLIGFSGSWLAGAVFWGWLRLHPLWHLPVEAFALPLAIAGLQGPWRRAGQFYLGALIGTACTDAATALCGLMPLWPQVLQASPSEAPYCFLQQQSRCCNRLPWLWWVDLPRPWRVPGAGSGAKAKADKWWQPPCSAPWLWMACFWLWPC